MSSKSLLGALLFSLLFTFVMGTSPGKTFAAQPPVPNKGTLASGTSQTLTFTSPDEVHTYQFSTLADGEMTITLQGIKGRVKAYLYDGNGNYILGVDSSSYENIFVTGSNYLKKGIYYLTVSPYGWENSRSSGQYTVKATYSSDPVTLDSNYEPNDVSRNGRSLKNGETVSSTFSADVDQDWYQINTVDYGEIYIQFSKIKGRFKASIYDENGNYVTSIDTSSYDRTSMSTNLKAGKYFLQLYPYGWDNKITDGSYSLTATFAAGKTDHNSNFEPNDTSNNAYPIKSGVSYKSTFPSSTDVDWYRVENVEDGDLYVTFEGIKGRMKASLYDDNGNYMNSIDSSSYTNSSLSATLKKGVYYIQLFPYGWEERRESGEYTINATYRTAATNYDTQFEPNNTFDNGFPIVPGRNYSSSLVNNVDVDWYKIVTNKDGKIKVNFNNVKGRIYVYLYDEYKNYKGSWDSSSYNSLSIESEVKSGAYFMQISPYGWEDKRTSGTYSFTASFPSNAKIAVKVNGKNLSTSPAILNGVIYLPVQDVLKVIGGSASLKGKTVTIKAGNQTYVVNVDTTAATQNGKKMALGSPFKTAGGKVLVPISFMPKLGAKVSWDTNNGLIISK